MSQSTSPPFEAGYDASARDQGARHCGGKGLTRRWSAWEVGAMVAGFVIFWPLGLVAIFLKWKNGEMWSGASDGKAPWAGVNWKGADFQAWKSQAGFGGQSGRTGNAAFDEYRRNELARLEEERRKLEAEQREFVTFLERLRKAKDQDEFDRFMAERRAAQAPSAH